jgi:hypothetical protein
MGLIIAEEKTTYMEVTTRPTNIQFLSVNNYGEYFKHLGTSLTSSNNITTETDNRIMMANKCYSGFKNKLWSHYITIL